MFKLQSWQEFDSISDYSHLKEVISLVSTISFHSSTILNIDVPFGYSDKMIKTNWILETKEHNLLTVVTFPMSIQIYPNNCKILLDATAAAPYAPEKFNPNLKDVPPNIPAEVTGAPTAENNIILPVTLLIKHSEWRIYIESFSSEESFSNFGYTSKNYSQPIYTKSEEKA